jgi:hypothetical protein
VVVVACPSVLDGGRAVLLRVFLSGLRHGGGFVGGRV